MDTQYHQDYEGTNHASYNALYKTVMIPEMASLVKIMGYYNHV